MQAAPAAPARLQGPREGRGRLQEPRDSRPPPGPHLGRAAVLTWPAPRPGPHAPARGPCRPAAGARRSAWRRPGARHWHSGLARAVLRAVLRAVPLQPRWPGGSPGVSVSVSEARVRAQQPAASPATTAEGKSRVYFPGRPPCPCGAGPLRGGVPCPLGRVGVSVRTVFLCFGPSGDLCRRVEGECQRLVLGPECSGSWCNAPRGTC